MFSSKHLINTKNSFYLKIVCNNHIKCLINSVDMRYYHTPYKCLLRLSVRDDCHRILPFMLSQSKPLSLHRHQSTNIERIPTQPKNVETLPKKKAFVGIAGIKQNESIDKLDIEWKRVYVCPFINAARLLARFKLYQTALLCASLPICGVMYWMGTAELITLQRICAFAGLACLVLNVFGQIFRRLVGAVYISDCGTFAKISHLTFFGNRREIYTDISDIEPLIDVNDNLRDFYCIIQRLSTNEPLYMSLKFGGILDREGFETVFGKDSAILSAQNR